jgi:hypothetical protein
MLILGTNLYRFVPKISSTDNWEDSDRRTEIEGEHGDASVSTAQSRARESG